MDKLKPDRIGTFVVPRAILDTTWEYLRTRGLRDLEGVVYWTGSATAVTARVEHALTPRGYDNEGPYHLEVGYGNVFDVIRAIHELDEFLLVRVHSHKEGAFHSWSDDDGCLSGREGMISIVVPRFAEDRATVDACAIFERTAQGAWRELGPAEVRRRFVVS